MIHHSHLFGSYYESLFLGIFRFVSFPFAYKIFRFALKRNKRNKSFFRYFASLIFASVSLRSEMRGHQRIYNSYRILSNLPSSLISGTFTLESRKKNDSAVSAAWWTIYRPWRISCKVYTIGWVNFWLFSNFIHLHVVYPGFNYGNAKFF